MSGDIIEVGRQARVAVGREIRIAKAVPPFSALKAFEAYGRLGGVRRAAAALGVDHAVVSRHLRSLEAWSGVALIDRSRASCGLTPKGADYHAHITVAIDMMADATASLMRSHDDHQLSIWCVPGLASRWLSLRLDQFCVDHADVELELRPSDSPPDLLQYEADADLRFFGDAWSEQPTDPRLVCLEIARPRVLAVASPAVAARLQEGGVSALLSASLLHEEHDEQWRAWLIARGVQTPDRLPGVRLWHAHMAVDAARRGQGVALANAFLLHDDLECGRLVEVAPPTSPREQIILGGYCLVGRRDRWQRPSLVRLRRWLQREVAAARPLAA